ncbi:outer membrane beta-barrel protein [Mucilaginibacter sp. NFX135]|uniref:outer membrane beta-barrel protein n=1 Tax=Mucilaginibacter sp. NFX135 TaxID=3402687 RepID=UPI003AFB5EF0
MSKYITRTGMIIAGLLLSASLIKAQAPANRVIKGRIVDEKKAALPFATLVLKNEQDTTLVKAALSSDKGFFSFNNIKPGTYRMAISMVGFQTLNKVNIVVDSGGKPVDLGALVLTASAKMLNSVTIRGKTPLVERLIDKTVVNVNQNITNAGLSVLEVIKKLPGVQITDDGQVFLNGKAGINVLVDGKPTYLSAQDLASLLRGMPSSNVQKIEIMTNPSAKYDASGNAGIINIVKKRNHREGFTGSVNGNLAQGYYGSYDGGINLGYKTEAYNLTLSNSYTFNKDFFNRSVTTDALGNNNALSTEKASNNNNISSNRTYSPSLGLDLYLSRQTTLSLTGNASVQSGSDLTISNMNILNGNRALTNTEQFSALNKDKPFNYTTGLSLVHKLDTLGREFSIDLDYSNYRNNPRQFNYTMLNDASGSFLSQSNVFLDQSRRLHIYAIKADYTQPLSGKGRLEAGLKSSYVKANNNNTYYKQLNGQNLVDSTQSDYSINSENINAAYINVTKPYKKLTVEAGLRAEQTVTKGQQKLTGQSVDQNFLSLFPTTFFDYKLNDNYGFTFRFGRRIERANYHELVPFRRPLTPTLYFEGNPNLKPQLTWHSELTWSWHQELSVTFGYDIDRNYVKTLPYLDSNKVTVTRIPTNIQHSGSWNIDFNYSKKLVKWWSTDNIVSFYRNHFSGQAGNFSLNNPGIVSVYFTSNNSFPLTDNLSAEADFEYDSRRQLITSSFGAYSVASVGVRQQLFGGRGSISLNARNIFQSENHNVIDRYESLYQYSYFNFYTRAVRLNFSYRFGSGKTAKSRTESGSADEQKRAGS